MSNIFVPQKTALGHFLAKDGAPGTGMALTPVMQDALNGLGAIPHSEPQVGVAAAGPGAGVASDFKDVVDYATSNGKHISPDGTIDLNGLSKDNDVPKIYATRLIQ